MIRKTLWIIPILLSIAAIGTPTALADIVIDGTLNFTLSTGTQMPTGSFVFDNTTSTFTNFVVSWNGELFDFTSAANFTTNSFPNLPFPSQPDTWAVCDFYVADPSFCPGGAPGVFFLFLPNVNQARMTAVTPSNLPANFNLRNILGTDATGFWSVSETVVATPEPSSFILMLIGIGLVLVMRKRFAKVFPQTT